MGYSCADFTDSILDALGITVPRDALDDPEAQADLALAEIERLQTAASRQPPPVPTNSCGTIRRTDPMDPNACLTALLDAFRDGDREAAWEHLEALYDWLAKGGFMPTDPRTASKRGN